MKVVSYSKWSWVVVSEQSYLKGGYLDFSHLAILKNIYITEIHMGKKKKKQYKSSIIKNHKLIKNIYFFYGVPLEGYVAS